MKTMSRREILVEHYYNQRFLKSRRFKASVGHVLFGSSPAADVRLMGQDVNGIHAMIEFENDEWQLLDLASPTGTRIDGEPIVEKVVKQDTVVRIGHHEIRLQPIQIDSYLFQPGGNEKSPAKNSTGDLFHQVIVRRNGLILHTKVLARDEKFAWGDPSGDMVFSPPPSEEWVVHEFGSMVVQQRLVKAETLSVEQNKIEISRSEKMSLGIVGTIALLLLVALLLPSKPQAPEALEAQDNVYAKMILDPEMLKKKRSEAQQVRKKLTRQKTAQTAAATAKNQSNAPKASAPTASKQDGPKVLTNVKSAQLGQILGRISQRADSARGLASAIGQQQSKSRLRGSGMASVKDAAGLTIGSGSSASSNYKIAAVGTSGRGGGLSNLKGLGTLSSGTVGAADVGMIEDEAEVDGGLDREVIAQYIKSQLGQIRYCYERQLSANPDLYGKVQIKFTIAANGSVSTHTIGQTTLKSAMVEGCILRRVAQWKFPMPKGGTHVRVTYPFLFKSTN